MKKILVLNFLIIASINAFSQEKIALGVGINRLQPKSAGSGFEAQVGSQCGIYFRKTLGNSFLLEKGISLVISKFEDTNAGNVLILKNTTHSICVPFLWYYTRIKYIHPFLGVEGNWRFNSDTDYFVPSYLNQKVSELQFSIAMGAEATIVKNISLNLKYSMIPYLITIGNMDLWGFQIGVKYSFERNN